MRLGSVETTADSWILESARSESASNDAGRFLTAHAAAATGGARPGWDPYDVWLRRIRLPREQKRLEVK